MAEPMHPILRTGRSEIADTCRDPENNGLAESNGEYLALAVEAASEEEIARIASKLGDYMMDGGRYWDHLPLAAEAVLGVQLERPLLDPIESDAALGPRQRLSPLASRTADPSPEL
jgi:hypothetical protein